MSEPDRLRMYLCCKEKKQDDLPPNITRAEKQALWTEQLEKLAQEVVARFPMVKVHGKLPTLFALTCEICDDDHARIAAEIAAAFEMEVHSTAGSRFAISND